MKNWMFCMFSLISAAAYGQGYPANAQVIRDVKGYNESLETAQVDGAWRLEKEAGYTFSNMAKIVVRGLTRPVNGVSKKLVGLAIYVRGAATDPWAFSRYFVTSTEYEGLAPLSATELVAQTHEMLAATPINILPNMNDVAWVYGVSIAEGVQPTQDLSGDFLYSPAYIEYEEKFIDYEFPFEGGIRRLKMEVTLYVRPVDGALRVARASRNSAEPVQAGKTFMSKSAWEALPMLGQKPYAEMSGPQGPALPASAGNRGNNNNNPPQQSSATPGSEQPASSPQNNRAMPRLRVGIRKN